MKYLILIVLLISISVEAKNDPCTQFFENQSWSSLDPSTKSDWLTGYVALPAHFKLTKLKLSELPDGVEKDFAKQMAKYIDENSENFEDMEFNLNKDPDFTVKILKDTNTGEIVAGNVYILRETLDDYMYWASANFDYPMRWIDYNDLRWHYY